MKKALSHLVLWALLALFLSISTFAEGSAGYIVELEAPLPALLSLSDGSVQEIAPRHNLYLVSDPALVEALQQEGLLLSAVPDCPVELFTGTETDTGDTTGGETETGTGTGAEATPVPQPDLWHLETLGVLAADALGCFGQGVTIALIDSGVSAHEELTDSLLPGHNYLDGSSDVTDNIGHGTFAAGLIAASDDGEGLSGAAPGAMVLPLKCFDTGASTTVATICAAIYDAVDVYGCKLINMSFGLTSDNSALRQAVDYAAAQGVLLTAAVGNRGTAQLYYPAAYDSVIGVGAVDSGCLQASFSQTNASVLVTAPGKDLCSAASTGGWRTDSGTSFSAPLVTAVLARLLNVDPTLDLDAAAALLSATAADLGEAGYDTAYGHGLVGLTAALDSLLGDVPAFLSPVRITGGQAALYLTNRSDQPLSVMAGLYDEWGRFAPLPLPAGELSAGQAEVILFSLPEDTQALSARAFLLESTFAPRLPFLQRELTLN